MTKEEILHLGTLSRIRLNSDEVDKLHTEIEEILEYVGKVDEIVGDVELTKKVGPVHNVFREDEVTNTPGSLTDDLVDSFPESEGQYLKVKKILNPDA